jgi:hypothetical protein
MTLDELHRKTVYYGSAVAVAMVLALATSSHWYAASPRYAYVREGTYRCLEDVNSGTFAPTADGMPSCTKAELPPAVRRQTTRR